MKRRTPPNLQRSLPGMPCVAAVKDGTPVTLPMTEIPPGTDKAWLLKPLGVGSDKSAWAARSLVTRGDGPQASQFSMPRWLAVENGWLK